MKNGVVVFQVRLEVDSRAESRGRFFEYSVLRASGTRVWSLVTAVGKVGNQHFSALGVEGFANKESFSTENRTQVSGLRQVLTQLKTSSDGLISAGARLVHARLLPGFERPLVRSKIIDTVLSVFPLWDPDYQRNEQNDECAEFLDYVPIVSLSRPTGLQSNGLLADVGEDANKLSSLLKKRKDDAPW